MCVKGLSENSDTASNSFRKSTSSIKPIVKPLKDSRQYFERDSLGIALHQIATQSCLMSPWDLCAMAIRALKNLYQEYRKMSYRKIHLFICGLLQQSPSRKFMEKIINFYQGASSYANVIKFIHTSTFLVQWPTIRNNLSMTTNATETTDSEGQASWSKSEDLEQIVFSLNNYEELQKKLTLLYLQEYFICSSKNNHFKLFDEQEQMASSLNEELQKITSLVLLEEHIRSSKNNPLKIFDELEQITSSLNEELQKIPSLVLLEEHIRSSKNNPLKILDKLEQLGSSLNEELQKIPSLVLLKEHIRSSKNNPLKILDKLEQLGSSLNIYEQLQKKPSLVFHEEHRRSSKNKHLEILNELKKNVSNLHNYEQLLKKTSLLFVQDRRPTSSANSFMNDITLNTTSIIESDDKKCAIIPRNRTIRRLAIIALKQRNCHRLLKEKSVLKLNLLHEPMNLEVFSSTVQKYTFTKQEMLMPFVQFLLRPIHAYSPLNLLALSFGTTFPRTFATHLIYTCSRKCFVSVAVINLPCQY